jgi:hypothetical protein
MYNIGGEEGREEEEARAIHHAGTGYGSNSYREESCVGWVYENAFPESILRLLTQHCANNCYWKRGIFN